MTDNELKRKLDEIYDSLYMKRVFWPIEKLREKLLTDPDRVQSYNSSLLDELSIYHIATELKAGDLDAVMEAAREKIKHKANPTPEERQLLNNDFIAAACLAVSLLTPEEIAETVTAQYKDFY